MLDEACGPAAVDRDHRQPACLRFEHDLTERLGRAREQEHVGARVGARQFSPVLPAEERGLVSEALAQRVLLRTAAGKHEMQARVAGVSDLEGVRQ